MNTFFSYSKKKWFLRIRKIQKIKTHPTFLNKFFCVFYFQKQKTVHENKKQTDPKALFKNCLFLIIFTQKIKFDGFTTEAIFFENLFRKLFASNTR